MTLQVRDDLRKYEIGVVVGRFQVHKLHSEHIDLIRTVQERHQRTIILLGLAPTKATRRNPLDFQMRRQMIQEAFPGIDDIYYVDDHQNDNEWSRAVDREISKHVGNDRGAVLYGSRDSFVPHYHGRYPVCELEPKRIVSGTELRKITANKRLASEDFRAGVIYAVEQQYAHAWLTVDTAILSDDCARILLGRKRDDAPGHYRFAGGFVRTRLPSLPVDKPRTGVLEMNAKAESTEETHANLSAPTYVGNAVIDDWRYRNDQNEVLTVMFAARHLFGPIQADDDLDEVRWFDIDAALSGTVPVVDTHKPLMDLFVSWFSAGNRPA